MICVICNASPIFVHLTSCSGFHPITASQLTTAGAGAEKLQPAAAAAVAQLQPAGAGADKLQPEAAEVAQLQPAAAAGAGLLPPAAEAAVQLQEEGAASDLLLHTHIPLNTSERD